MRQLEHDRHGHGQASAATNAQPPAYETTSLSASVASAERCNLTNGQLVVWTGQRLVPHLPCYSNGVTFLIKGALDHAHFRRAFQALVDRSDALRTVIVEDDGVPVQRVRPDVKQHIPVFSLAAESDPMAALPKWAEDRLAIPPQLDQRLFDMALVELGPGETAWYLGSHHLLFDAWACLLIYQHTADFYQRSFNGTLQDAPDLPQFSAYVAAERRGRQSTAWSEADRYWRDVLTRPYEPVELYGIGPAHRSREERTVSVDLGASRTAALRALAGKPGFRSLNVDMSMLGIFSTLLTAYLYRVGGNPSISIGLPFQSRDRANTDTIGMAQQTYPLRVEVDSDETFVSLMRKTMRALMGLLAHAPLGSGNATHQAANDVLLNYTTLSFPDFAGLPVSTELVGKTTTDGSRSLYVLLSDFDDSGALRLDMSFNTGLFSESRAHAAAGHFLKLVDQLVADPTTVIDAVDLLSKDEREGLLDTDPADRAADQNWPRDKTIDQLVSAQVARTPDDIACISGSESLTYAQLDSRANQLAHHLQSVGAGPGVVVAVHAERCLDLVVSVLAIFKAGAAYLPLDTTYPGDRVDFILADSKAPILITQTGIAPCHLAGVGTVIHLEELDALLADCPASPPTNAATPEDLAYVIYTSGSTGDPKGAAIPQRALVNVIWWQMHEASTLSRPRTLQFSPLSFDVSMQELFATWSSGGVLVLPQGDVRRNPEALLRLLIDAEIEQLYAIFTPIQQLADAVERLGLIPHSLREVFTAGEAVTITPTVERFFKKLPECRFQNQYGSSEDLIVSSYTLSGQPSTWPRLPPIGRPITNAKIYLLDSRLEPVPAGVPGEICIGGAQVALGYLHRPELTDERFVPCPFTDEPGAKMFRQGDLARLRPDGNIQFLGRLDNQIKLRGFRIEPGEVEAALAGHELVEETVVVAREDEPGNKRLVAYVVPAPTWSPKAVPELQRALAEKLPPYMIPSAFVTLEQLPKTPSGKLDRRALPAPDLERPELDTSYVAPRSELERGVAAIWQQVLGVDQVGLHDNFFSLGGHSLLLVQVHIKLRDRYRADLDITDLFRLPTVSAMAGFLSGEVEDAGLDAAADRAARQRSARHGGAKRLQDARTAHPLRSADDDGT